MGKNRSLWWAKCIQTPMCDQVFTYCWGDTEAVFTLKWVKWPYSISLFSQVTQIRSFPHECVSGGEKSSWIRMSDQIQPSVICGNKSDMNWISGNVSAGVSRQACFHGACVLLYIKMQIIFCAALKILRKAMALIPVCSHLIPSKNVADKILHPITFFSGLWVGRCRCRFQIRVTGKSRKKTRCKKNKTKTNGNWPSQPLEWIQPWFNVH